MERRVTALTGEARAGTRVLGGVRHQGAPRDHRSGTGASWGDQGVGTSSPGVGMEGDRRARSASRNFRTATWSAGGI